MKIKKKIGFHYAERGLFTSKHEIERISAGELKEFIYLKPYFKGSGWGLKYLVYHRNKESPTHLVKAASRVIERRLKRVLKYGYLPHPERFKREARTLTLLAEKGLGPAVPVCENDFFLREFLPGVSLAELVGQELETWLPEVLRTIDMMCNFGVLHTDPNAGNVIIDTQKRKIGFIDSEVPVEKAPQARLTQAQRAFCHERLLYTLGRALNRRLDSNEDPAVGKVLSAAYEYYLSAPPDVILAPQRAVDLLRGKAEQMEGPE